MKNKKIAISCTGLLLLAAVNFFLFKIALKNSLDLMEVYVARSSIGPRVQVTEDMIQTILIPSAYLNFNTFLNKEEIVGKWTDIQGMIPEGSLFYKTMLYDEKTLPDMPSLLLKENQVVYSMATDLISSAGNSLIPHQKVDIYCTIEPQRNKPIVDLLISNVRILSLKDRNGVDMQSEKSQPVPYVITIALDQDQISILSNAVKLGSIQMYASSSSYEYGEESVLNTDSLVLEYLIHGFE